MVISSVAVIGDSGSVGFGTGGRSYPVLLAEAFGAGPPLAMAALGKTTAMAIREDLPVVAAHRPDLVVLQTGMADSLVHPGRRVQSLLERFAPPSWHGVDGLERRAVFRGRRRARLRQRATAWAKTALKRILVRAGGGFTRTDPEAYEHLLDELLTGLEEAAAVVVSIAVYTIDERIFPRQGPSTAAFLDVHRRVLSRHAGVLAVEPDVVLRRWDDYLDDHGHWNAAGHRRVAGAVVAALRTAGHDEAVIDLREPAGTGTAPSA